MKKLLTLGIIACSMFAARAQTFHGTVKIEFEKTVYIRQLYRDMAPQWYDMIKDRLPNTTISYYDFTGDTSASLYKQGRSVAADPRAIGMSIAENNVVYNNYRAGTTTTQKPVFEEVFLVQDSLLKIKWRLTADTRIIAGYECRKAVGIIDDSIAVFAFYTEEILVSGGPEGIQGLPGMILGVGVPRIHATWFATKVEVNGVTMKGVTPATKGKKVTRRELMTAIDKALKNWGNYGRSMYLNFVI